MSLLIAAALAAAPPVERQLTAPGPHGAARRHLARRRQARAGGGDHPRLGPDRPRRQQSARGSGVDLPPARRKALPQRGVTTVRIDKRGMFGSKAAIANPNAVTIADYAADAHAWAKAARAATGARCVWLLGHSEGGLVALAAAQDRKDICGVISVSGAGRRLGTIIREQLVANPANAPLSVVGLRRARPARGAPAVQQCRHSARAAAVVRRGDPALHDRPAGLRSAAPRRLAQGAAAGDPGRPRPAGHPGRCPRAGRRSSPRRNW